jgi:3alpha(or 20beta)-hydroxysteroid dehydrogenase
MGRLTGKIAIITGASNGMGASHAFGFVAEGARVILTDIDEESGDRGAKLLGENAAFVKHDVTNPADWAQVVQIAEQRFGPVSVLVNNAGIGEVTVGVAEYDQVRWRRIVEVNLFGCFFGIQAVVPSMRKAGGGSIINVASAHGIVGGPRGASPYSASKFAVRGLTRTAAIDLGSDHIRVNTLCPGLVRTHMSREVAAASSDFAAGYPIPRFGTPMEQTHLAVFLASDESSFCTGSDFSADGGMTAGLRER